MSLYVMIAYLNPNCQNKKKDELSSSDQASGDEGNSVIL